MGSKEFWIKGISVAGTVVPVGKNAKELKVGDEVFAFTGARLGCHVEYKRMPENGAMVLKPLGRDLP